MIKRTRFDLESEIMNCWNVVDDVKVIAKYIGDHEDFKGMDDAHTDKILNLLIGLESLYQVKFDNLFKTFEQLAKEGKL